MQAKSAKGDSRDAEMRAFVNDNKNFNSLARLICADIKAGIALAPDRFEKLTEAYKRIDDFIVRQRDLELEAKLVPAFPILARRFEEAMDLFVATAKPLAARRAVPSVSEKFTLDVKFKEVQECIKLAVSATQMWGKYDGAREAARETSELTSEADPYVFNGKVAELGSTASAAVREVRDAAYARDSTDSTMFMGKVKEATRCMRPLYSVLAEMGLSDDEQLLRVTLADLLAVARALWRGKGTEEDLKSAETAFAAALRRTLENAKALPPSLRTSRSKQSMGLLERRNKEKVEREKRERMREHALKELVASEALYTRQLSTLSSKFILPLRSRPADELSGAAKLRALLQFFSSIEGLTAELSAELDREVNTGSGSRLVGPVFKKLAPMLKMYSSYINMYDDAMDELRVLRERAAFEKFVQAFNQEAEVQDVSFFLILPIQRLPRYEMLIGGLLKFTEESHDDFEGLNQALKMTREVNSFVNEKKRVDENRRKLHDIEAAVSFPRGIPAVHLFGTSRMYLREGLVEGVKRKDRRYVFFFNDLMLLCQVQNNTIARRRLTPVRPPLPLGGGSSSGKGDNASESKVLTIGREGIVARYSVVDVVQFAGAEVGEITEAKDGRFTFSVGYAPYVRDLLLPEDDGEKTEISKKKEERSCTFTAVFVDEEDAQEWHGDVSRAILANGVI